MFFIVGPTAVGKTEIAVEVAARLDAEIIGADAFQIYDGLEILTAKPPEELRARVPHHLIGEIPLTQSFDVAQYLDAARARIREIAARGKRVLVVGGTGLYVRALTRGLADLPKADAAIRAELEKLALEQLQARFTELDPEGAALIDMKNPRRLVRAIEVCLLAGKPFSSFQNEWERPPDRMLGVLLTRERGELYARINARTKQMFAQGVIEEVRSLDEIGPTASQVIGRREVQALIRGELSEAECIACIQQATRRYAKRQLTWFQRDPMFEQINLTANFSDPTTVTEVILQRFRSAFSER